MSWESLSSGPARVKFMEADGASVLLKFITLPEIFPKSLIEVLPAFFLEFLACCSHAILPLLD
jgi:hypothetical protein